MLTVRICLVFVLSACGTGPDCDMADVVLRTQNSQPHYNCGDLPDPMFKRTQAEPAWRGTFECVREKVANRSPFQVSFALQPLDSVVLKAYVGEYVDAAWSVTEYTYDSYGGGQTSWAVCPDLLESAPCDSASLFGSLCFRCSEGGHFGGRCPAL